MNYLVASNLTSFNKLVNWKCLVLLHALAFRLYYSRCVNNITRNVYKTIDDICMNCLHIFVVTILFNKNVICLTSFKLYGIKLNSLLKTASHCCAIEVNESNCCTQTSTKCVIDLSFTMLKHNTLHKPSTVRYGQLIHTKALRNSYSKENYRW